MTTSQTERALELRRQIRSLREQAASLTATAHHLNKALNLVEADIIQNSPMVEIIIDEVCGHTHLEREEILCKSRTQRLSSARQLLCYVVREVTGLSFPKVGRMVNRDHATVIHSYNLTTKRMASAAYAAYVQALIGRINERIKGSLAETPTIPN